MKTISVLSILFIFACSVFSFQEYCSEIQPDGIFINHVSIEGTAKKGWSFSYYVETYAINTVTEGELSIEIRDKNGNHIYDKVLPFCNEIESDICSLDFEVETKKLSGYIPVYIPEDIEESQFNVIIKINAMRVDGTPTETCFTTDFETEDFNTEGCGKCGGIMYTFRGVPAYSNGGNQGTGVSCAGTGQFGLRYQCVEFVQRYYKQFFPVQFAKQMCASKPSRFKKVSSPNPGDVYVNGNGQYGHTAIVIGSGKGYVDVAEQNGNCAGKTRYSTSTALCFLRV